MADKKGIKEWVKDIGANEELAKKFEGKESPEEIIALAKEEGYEFTVDDLMDLKMEAVSGGFVGEVISTGFKIVKNLFGNLF